MISIIIRAKNEERWIGWCLRAIQAQEVDEPFEIVLVDNGSSDRTVPKALAIIPDIRVVSCPDPYRPGRAINIGVEAARGERLILISAHCVPTNTRWMANLLNSLLDEGIAGAYGRQIPFGFSRAADKRDLWQLFGLDPRIQTRDGFFHNANSIVSRRVWEILPFDENVLHVEDLLWGERVISRGYKLAYEPQACVYHHHGVNHHNHPERCEATVKVLEGLASMNSGHPADLDMTQFDVVALIAVREPVSCQELFDRHLLQATIHSARDVALVRDVLVSTESEELAALARLAGAQVPFIRSRELAHNGVRIDEVLTDMVLRLGEQGRYPDVILALELPYPCRPEGLLSRLIEKLLIEDLDTVIPAIAERRPCWVFNDRNMLERCDDYKTDQRERQPIYVGVPGLGCAIRSDVLHERASRFGARVGIVEINDPLIAIPMSSRERLRTLGSLLLPGLCG